MKTYAIAFVVFIGVGAIQATALKNDTVNEQKLGELLFFDPILSKDSTISCASCHLPQYAFSDTSAVSIGVDGRKGARNTPTAMNLRLNQSFFWDGRAATLEDQAIAPIENPAEMNFHIADAVLRLKNSPTYSRLFWEVFNSEPSRSNLAKAIAAFERTLETSDSPFDNWKFSEDSTTVTASMRRGFAIFNAKAKCVKCHFGPDFTAHEFWNIGLFDGRKFNDSGRFVVTGKPLDIGRFKTSSLRNIEVTGPYMHNGMFTTLEQVIDFYDDTKKIVPNPINRDTLLLQPLGLTNMEKRDLKAFLLSLTDKKFKSK